MRDVHSDEILDKFKESIKCLVKEKLHVLYLTTVEGTLIIETTTQKSSSSILVYTNNGDADTVIKWRHKEFQSKSLDVLESELMTKLIKFVERKRRRYPKYKID